MPMNGVLSEATWGTWDALRCPNGRSSGDHTGQSDITSSSVVGASERSKKKLDRKGLRAPKESQLWFEEVLARIDGDAFGQSHCVYRCNPLLCQHTTSASASARSATSSPAVIPWDALPQGIHPRDGKLPPERIRKKRHQVENLAVFLQRLLRPGDRVVEFCAGSGYVALPLACMFPQCTFVVLDMKRPSLAIAEERIAAAQLTNVEIFCGVIDDYDSKFDVGIALHACGEATDMVMQKCLNSNAAFVLAPCCVGKIKLSALQYPRSQTLRDTLQRNEYEVLARAADFGHTNDAAMSRTPVNVRRRKCKSLLESDRNALAKEHGYETFMFVMHPHNATPKNDVLVGIPPVTGGSSETTKRTLLLKCERVLVQGECERVIFGIAAE